MVQCIVQEMPAWFPGAGFKRYAEKMRPEVGEAVKDKPWEEFIAGMEVRPLVLIYCRPTDRSVRNGRLESTKLVGRRRGRANYMTNMGRTLISKSL